ISLYRDASLPLARALGPSSRLGCSLRFILPVPRGYRSLAMARVSSQRLPFLASRWWLPACAPLLVANSWRSPASSLESTPSWHVSSSLPWTSLSGSCEASAVFNVSAFRGKIFSQLQINHGGRGSKRYRDSFAAPNEDGQ